MDNWDSPEVVERLLSALERIAMALELATGLGRPEEDAPEGILESSGPTSSLSYVVDEHELRKEIRREGYFRRTGRKLGPEEEVPVAGPGKGARIEGVEEAPEGDPDEWLEVPGSSR